MGVHSRKTHQILGALMGCQGRLCIVYGETLSTVAEGHQLTTIIDMAVEGLWSANHGETMPRSSLRGVGRMATRRVLRSTESTTMLDTLLIIADL